MKKKFIIATCLIVLTVPVFAQAAIDWWPIVPCGLNKPTVQEIQDGAKLLDESYYQDCNQCTLIKLADNLIDMIVQGLVPILGTFFFLLGGFLILLGNAMPTWIQKGKDIMKNTAYGIAIVLGSYLIANFIFVSLASSDIISKANWGPTGVTITCKVGTLKDIVAGTAPGPAPVGGEICTRPQALAAQYNEFYPKRNAPELDQFISCIKSKLPGENLGSMYTWDVNKELCNYSRGNPTCSTCSHKVDSCHYGGKTGSKGSLAVDFGNAAIGQRIVNAAISCGVPAAKARCENTAGANVGCSSGSGATHVHVSAPSCDAN